MARLEQLSGNHATCSITEFAAWMKVSRQTVYNWKGSNYLVFAGNKSIFLRRWTYGCPFRGSDQSSTFVVLAPVAGDAHPGPRY